MKKLIILLFLLQFHKIYSSEQIILPLDQLLQVSLMETAKQILNHLKSSIYKNDLDEVLTNAINLKQSISELAYGKKVNSSFWKEDIYNIAQALKKIRILANYKFKEKPIIEIHNTLATAELTINSIIATFCSPGPINC